MSGAEVIAVVACVAAVVSAYSDGAKLFNAVKKKRDRRRQSNETTVADLECSLALGQTEILTHWNIHAAQLGRRYEEGDDISRDQMKDIVITLQGMLLTHLRASVEKNASLNMMSLLMASNQGRARTIMVLHELYERIALTSPAPYPMPTSRPSLDPLSSLAHHMQFYNGKDLSQTSAPKGWPIPSITPPKPSTGSFFRDTMSVSPKDMAGASDSFREVSPSPKRHERKSSSIGTTMSSWFNNMSRNSSKSDGPPMEPEVDVAKLANTTAASPRKMKRDKRRPSLDQEEVITGDEDPLYSNPWADELKSDSGVEFESDPGSSDDEAIFTMAEEYPEPRSHQKTSLAGSFPNCPDSLPQRPAIPPGRSHSPPLPPSVISHASGTSDISSRSTETTVSDSLHNKNFWPPRKDNRYLGFCKGAWSLSSGTGTFKLMTEPYGIYGRKLRWRCPSSSCFFGMPLAGPVARRKDAAVDHSIHTHVSTGIRYRWAFLAKNHVPKRDGMSVIMGFGCVFCCVEHDTAAPLFPSVDEFMLHLVSHRGVDHDGLLALTKCVVGRVAEDGDDFDINIPPLLVGGE
ncbi:hypothetical protein N7468_008814 [Penicillium chermesinum]|uniref:Uncharacterized protein n=1 Tax=Penicillium chermesinum TaxID=63820 RepID=A0A9W9NGL8_9EURO|nr:uncharacterized protein N7468_008814 [Penicillium chermesinum]KAJ5219610.1 hypothetical protein N7468_008814 [Penicillium chermesinum]